MPTFARITKRGFGKLKRQSWVLIDVPAPPSPPGPDDQLQYLSRLLDDDRLAQRVRKLQEQFPSGTVPELVVYDWLSRSGLTFDYQVELFGGRRAPRGMGFVPDFVVAQDASHAMVWAIQGEYWHSLPGKEQADDAARLATLGAVINGKRIQNVVELWEEDVYRRRPQIFHLALAGMGLR